jgi:hypothetical protein
LTLSQAYDILLETMEEENMCEVNHDDHTEVRDILNATTLSQNEKMDLYEMYLEEIEEGHSIATAIEKTEASIKDIQS